MSSPSELWAKANEVYPNDPEARRTMYLDLMRAAGHIVPADSPDAGGIDLPCGWPRRRLVQRDREQ